MQGSPFAQSYSLAKLGMVYRVGAQRADLVRLGLFDLEMAVSETGHPAFVVNDIGDISLGSSSGRWDGDPEVQLWDSTAVEQYMAASGAAGEGSGEKFKPLFFPKKVSPAVSNMLQDPNISPSSFFMWWKNANQSRDFWIENEHEMIRIHVVPKKDAFNPAFWNTSLQELKGKLLNMLGTERTTDIIPCHSDGLQHARVASEWNKEHGESHFKHAGGLWIGRSRFKKPSVVSFRDARQPVLPNNVDRAELTMALNKAELIRELDALQIPIHPKWTLPELRQTLIEHRQQRTGLEENAIKGLGRLSLGELKNKCQEHRLEVPQKATRGLLIKMLRQTSQPSGEQVMNFGKYKSWMYQEVPIDYLRWAVREAEVNDNAGDDLSHFAAWAKAELEKRASYAQKSGAVPYNQDVEAKAITQVPKMAVSSAPCSSWSRVSSRASPKRASSEEESVVSVMDTDFAEEAQAELLRLETEMALVKQKYRVSGRTPPASPGDAPRK